MGTKYYRILKLSEKDVKGAAIVTKTGKGKNYWL